MHINARFPVIFFLIFYIITTPVISSVTYAADTADRIRWYVSTKTMGDSGNSLIIGSSPQKFDLNGGWSCLVSSWDNEKTDTRQVKCQSEGKYLEFSVMCDVYHKEDHTQIRFSDDATDNLIDYIHLACERLE